MDHIGELISKIRRDKHITQEHLAAACGISKSGLQKIEYGARRPTYQLAKRLLAELGIDIQLIDKATKIQIKE